MVLRDIKAQSAAAAAELGRSPSVPVLLVPGTSGVGPGHRSAPPRSPRLPVAVTSRTTRACSSAPSGTAGTLPDAERSRSISIDKSGIRTKVTNLLSTLPLLMSRSSARVALSH